MPPPYLRGQIVVATVNDPQGRNPKPRPCVVVSFDESNAAGNPLALIAITGELGEVRTEDRVDLPYLHDRRHPVTGLDKPCAAACFWQEVVPQDAVLRVLGTVPPEPLHRILARVGELVAAARAARDAAP